MTDSFGARLRRRREEQGIALVAIAEQTKIKTSLLEALERDDVSQWPSGIFRRAFIRAYAHAIGLDPDVIVREFLEIHPEPDELEAAASLVSADSARTNGGPPTRLRQMVGSAFGSLARLRRNPAPQERAAAGVPPRTGAPLEPAAAADYRLRPVSRGGWDTAAEHAVSGPAAPPTAHAVEPAPARGAGVVDLAPLEGLAVDEPGLDLRTLDEPPIEEPAVVPASAPPPVVDPPVETPPPRMDVAAAPANQAEPDPSTFEPDFLALAHLCTQLGRVADAEAIRPLLHRTADVLDAAGLIVWIWDGIAEHLSPALVHGYSERVVAQLPAVAADADNATAAAFRSAQPCAIAASDHTCSALVVPLLTPAGCAGVLAIELQPGREQSRPVRAAVTILAALLAQLVGGATAAAPPVPTRVPQPAARPRTQPVSRLERA